MNPLPTQILLAEDDDNLRNGLAEILTLEGYACHCVPDGKEALDAFHTTAPDVVILDVMMPKLNGLELCKALRKRDPFVPILFLSARDTEVDRIVGLEHGADDYLVKPFGPGELIARIKSLLRRARLVQKKANSSTSRFLLDDLEIDVRALRAKRGDITIDLTAREVSLLRMLYDRHGEAISRNDILDECWGQDYFPNSRALDQYISALRKKIERNPATPRIIKTVYGFGYRFDP